MESKSNNFLAKINQQIENMVKKCSTCQQNQRKQQREPMKASDIPQSLSDGWIRYYYSRYWVIEKLYKTNSATVIKNLKHIFSRMGIPEVMKSDNGPHY